MVQNLVISLTGNGFMLINKTAHDQHEQFQMPKVGIEPTLPKEHEFESCASACSATSAFYFPLTRCGYFNVSERSVKDLNCGNIGFWLNAWHSAWEFHVCETL